MSKKKMKPKTERSGTPTSRETFGAIAQHLGLLVTPATLKDGSVLHGVGDLKVDPEDVKALVAKIFHNIQEYGEAKRRRGSLASRADVKDLHDSARRISKEASRAIERGRITSRVVVERLSSILSQANELADMSRDSAFFLLETDGVIKNYVLYIKRNFPTQFGKTGWITKVAIPEFEKLLGQELSQREAVTLGESLREHVKRVSRAR